MASSSFTANLGLCNWAATDRPKRADFVSDNNIIDNTVGTHIADTNVHMTAAEKEKALQPCKTYMYAGDGESTRTIATDFAPKMVIVFKKNAAPTEYSDGVTVINSAFSTYTHGSSAGLNVTSSGFVVQQQAQASGTSRISLNETGCQYAAVAFR